MGDKVTLVSPEGQATDVDAADVPKYLARRFRARDDDERFATDAADARKAEITPLDTGIVRGLSGATLGASDLAIRAIRGKDGARFLRENAEANPLTGTISDLAGGLAAGGVVGKLGKAAEIATGSGLAGLATEGGAYGFGGGVSRLAMSDDDITAERAAHVLGTDTLMGAGLGLGIGGAARLGSKALTKAGALLQQVGAARSAVDGLPEELAGLDEKGLRGAADAERQSIRAAADQERASLEAVRAQEKAKVAQDVEALHRTLAEESPIFHAVQGEDVEKIPGVTDVQVGLAKSFSRMRSAFDNPIGVAEKPFKLLDALQIRQTALEKLQPKIPELSMVLGDDARAAGLSAVDDALAQTKEQIARIKAFDAPAMSDRLVQLKAGSSPKLDAIEKAIEASKAAPALGMVPKGVSTMAYEATKHLVNMVPGLGIVAPFVGRAASDAVEKLFTHLSKGVTASAERSAGSFGALMSAGEKVAPVARRGATEVLATARYAPGPEPKSSKLADLYAARSRELRSQTTVTPEGETVLRPEVRRALGMRLLPIAQVMPTLADKIETATAAKIAYLSQALPKHPEIGGLQVGPDTWRPCDMEMRAFARKCAAAEDPHGVEERLAAGHVTPEEIEAYKACYPARYEQLQQQIASTAPQLAKTLPVNKKVALWIFTGVPTMGALVPNVLKQLQANFAVEPGSAGGMQAPKPDPNFGALGSLKDLDKPTASQARE